MTLTPAATVSTVVERLRDSGFLALTGAGMSTDSGIPDYRGPGSVSRTPMTFQEFRSGPVAQRHYWARSYLGWTRMHQADPNDGHHALAGLEAEGVCRAVITQNVDGLHERAGTRQVVALHGRIADVVCLGCGAHLSRRAYQRELADANPGWADEHRDIETRPDGDVALDETEGFRVVPCAACGGPLKPDVVFFGESVPPARVQRCYDLVDAAPALLVLGSSLTVMSGLRFVRHAAKRNIPVVIVNRGVTRGDDLATTLHEGTTEFLTDPAWRS